MNKKKIIITSISTVIILVFITFVSIISVIKYYLNKYNFNNESAMKTLGIYLNINKAYTIKEDEDYTTFIGNSNMNDYINLFEKKGYKQVDQLGNLLIFENDKHEQLNLIRTSDRCHFFTIYSLSDKIENYL